MKMLCVYCSSSDRLDQKYYTAAEAVGEAIGKRGWGLVYGGGKSGLMGAVARTVKRSGGRVVGVIPDFMTMRERKLLMEARADAFLALPGGWGTLEEIMEILTLRQLDVIRKPCVFFNQDGFYDDLLRFFEKMITEKFNKPSNLTLFAVAPTLEQTFAHLEAGAVAAETKWFVTN